MIIAAVYANAILFNVILGMLFCVK